MSTRGLLVVIHDGEPEVAQYSHFDSYPDGPGRDAVDFILHKMEKEKFRAALRECRYDEIDTDYEDDFLLKVQNGALRTLENSYWFAGNALFCEWAYVIDMDKEVFEVYKGFNHSPVPARERFSGLPHDDGYYPVKMVREYPFSELTDTTIDELIQELKSKAGGGEHGD
jgi:hypothetical protein